MPGEKYIVATTENPMQINIRNILNPAGYVFLGNCNDTVSLIRMIRSYSPDFAIIDIGMPLRDLGNTLNTIDDEMLCSCIIIGEYREIENTGMMDKYKSLSFCPRPLSKELLVHTVDISIYNFKRICELNKKLKDMTENYETRKSIERAKWVLMERDGLSEKDAYDRMRKKSMNNRLSIKDIADAIIFTYDITSKGNDKNK